MLYELKEAIKKAFWPYLWFMFLRARRNYYRYVYLRNRKTYKNMFYRRGYKYATLDKTIKKSFLLMENYLNDYDLNVVEPSRQVFENAELEVQDCHFVTYRLRYGVWYKRVYLRKLLVRTIKWRFKLVWLYIKWFITAVRINFIVKNNRALERKTGFHYINLVERIKNDPKEYRKFMIIRRAWLRGYRANLRWYEEERERLSRMKAVQDMEWRAIWW